MNLKLMALASALVLLPASAALAQVETPASADGQPTASAPAPNSPAQQPAGSPATPPEAAVAEPAAPASDLSITFNAGVANRYIFRGVDQTNDDPQIFVGADLAYKTFYAGVWASNVDFTPFGDPSTEAEIDVYGGFKKELGGFALDIGGIYYAYTNQPRNLTVDYVEGYIKGTRAFGPVTLGASLFVSPDFTGSTGVGVYAEGNAAYTVNSKLTLSGALGHQSIEDVDADYLTWNLGGTFALTKNFGVDLRYYDTDEHGFGDPYESKVVVSLKATFP